MGTPNMCLGIPCDRCSQSMTNYSTSIFNTESICPDCEIKEKAHPLYEKAKKAEREAVEKGDASFPGIGLPPDLHPRLSEAT